MERTFKPTLKLLQFAFGAPENLKACKDIPLGRRKNKVNIIGESHAKAKWLTTLKRIGSLDVVKVNLVEKHRDEAEDRHAKALAKLD